VKTQIEKFKKEQRKKQITSFKVLLRKQKLWSLKLEINRSRFYKTQNLKTNAGERMFYVKMTVCKNAAQNWITALNDLSCANKT
jgi:hypothetical protein